jgi:hypothetical protein
MLGFILFIAICIVLPIILVCDENIKYRGKPWGEPNYVRCSECGNITTKRKNPCDRCWKKTMETSANWTRQLDFQSGE